MTTEREQVPIRRRNPWLVWIFALITLGIYGLVWYYKVNHELAEMGHRVSPAGAVVAVTLGGVLIVPPFVSVFNTGDRIETTQRRAGIRDGAASPGLGVLLFIVLGFHLVYYQSHLNKVVDAHQEAVPA
jgi:hypothetical protein